MATKLVRRRLKQLRKYRDMTCREMAAKLGCCTSQYIKIENGERDGTMKFWRTFQKVFIIPDMDMWLYMNDLLEVTKR